MSWCFASNIVATLLAQPRRETAVSFVLAALLLTFSGWINEPNCIWFGRFLIDSEIETDDSLAQRLSSQVRLTCWVMTHPKNHATRAVAVNATWGRRCNKLLFMSTEADPVLGTIVLNTGEGREHLWDKTKEAFRYVYTNYLNESDWVVRADDDTYIVVENLRYMLRQYSPNDPWFFGCKFHYGTDHVFMSGGAGFALSREAVRTFVEQGIDENICDEGFGGVDDVAMGVCLAKLNVTFGDSTDEIKAQRFFPFPPVNHLIPNSYDGDHWYWKYRYDGSPDVRIDNCSSHVISFHYITPEEMRVMDYFLYEVNVHGRTRHSRPLSVGSGKH